MPAEFEEDGAGTETVVLGWTDVGATLVGFALEEPGAGAPVAAPGGAVVGTVAGWLAVFHDAVVGTAVVATAGEAMPNGVGPGTVNRNMSGKANQFYDLNLLA